MDINLATNIKVNNGIVASSNPKTLSGLRALLATWTSWKC